MDWASWCGQHVFSDKAETPWREMLAERFCILHDDAMGFLLDTATEVTARTRLEDDSKTVQQGGLWYEESLPTETILYGLVVASPARKFKDELDNGRIFTALAALTATPLQLGGKATVGRGLCQVRMQA